MLSFPIDLTGVLWEAEHSDGKIIRKGPQKYPLINRESLETFSLLWHNKPILTVHPANRTLVWRFKTQMQTMVVSGETSIKARLHIVALLAKPRRKETTQKCNVEHNPGLFQYYAIDKEESKIYYLFENAKQEIRTKFSNFSPYRPLHLREEEFNHLLNQKENGNY